MKKLLLISLMMLMLTPSLVCAMPQCLHGMGGTEKSSPPPCHGDQGHHGKKKAEAPMLMKDCSNTDLFASSADTGLKIPDIAAKAFMASGEMLPQHDFYFRHDRAIRGPPPDWPVVSQRQPSILLITQRRLI